MGYPVVHFEITGKDSTALHKYYGELFNWQIDAENPMAYGLVSREGNQNADGSGSAAASPKAPRAIRAT